MSHSAALQAQLIEHLIDLLEQPAESAASGSPCRMPPAEARPAAVTAA
jgi:hypothetical protein